MTPSAIIFDFGNVLDYVDDPAPLLARREALAASLHVSGDELWSLLYNSEAWELSKRGQITRADYLNRVFGPLGLTDSISQSEFADQLSEGRHSIHPDMLALLLALKPRYRLAILSNTHIVEMEDWFVETHGLANLFDVVISSAKVGLAKPEPEIYRLTLDRLGVAPGDALFIDDMPRNTQAAEALGLPSIVFESPAQLRRALQARHILIGQEQ